MAAASDSGAYYSSNVLSTQTDGAYNLTTPLSTPQRIPSHPLIFKHIYEDATWSPRSRRDNAVSPFTPQYTRCDQTCSCFTQTRARCVCDVRALFRIYEAPSAGMSFLAKQVCHHVIIHSRARVRS